MEIGTIIVIIAMFIVLCVLVGVSFRIFRCDPKQTTSEIQNQETKQPKHTKPQAGSEKVPDGVIRWIGTVSVRSFGLKAGEAKIDFSEYSTGPIRFGSIWGDVVTQARHGREPHEFCQSFLIGDGKLEEAIGEQTLRYGILTKTLTNRQIIEQIGGETEAETTLSELYGLLRKQPKGEDGALLNNGKTNVFYIRNRFGDLRDVIVAWRRAYRSTGDVYGWSIECSDRLRYGSGFGTDCRVFARKPPESIL